MKVEFSTALNFNTIKESTVKEVITQCVEYVKTFSSNEAAKQFLNACEIGNNEEVKKILIDTLNRAKENLFPNDLEKVIRDTSQYDVNREVINHLNVSCQKPKNDPVLQATDGVNKRRESTILSIDTVVVIVAILLVIAALGAVVYLKSKENKKVGDILSHTSRNKKKMVYTEKDRDMMLLIRELAEVYENTENYLKS